jgi:branched-chain amino acid aminotransferase
VRRVRGGALGTMSTVVYVNGTISDEKHAVVSALDHGLLFGEGIYETLRTYNGRPFLWDRHAARLRTSASMIELPVPWSDEDLYAIATSTMNARASAAEAYIRILVTRGVGELSYDPTRCPAPSLIVIAKDHVSPSAEAFEAGVEVARVSIIRNHPETVNPLIKSNNLLNNALAMQQALKRGAVEALMKNYRGEYCECSQSNFFLVKDGVALTPGLASGLLRGVTRDFLFEVGTAVGVPVRESIIRDPEIEGADEMFITSSTREVLPVARVDGRPVGAGRPGPITLRLLDGYRRAADRLTRG